MSLCKLHPDASALPGETATKTSRGTAFSDFYYPSSLVLGSGSYARVESYKRVTDNEDVAVKIVEVYGSDRSRHKVFKEIEIYSLCSGHPHIINLIQYFEEDGLFYLVFPRMAGSLFDTIVKRGRLTELEAANVVRQIASGLAYLHAKGIAHRDIKPENILCAKEGHLDPVKICDFDLGSPVKLVREGRSTTPTLLTPVGSAEFMAPEVVDAWLTDQASAYDKKCDVWSLGVFAYVICCGYAPFNGSCGNKTCGWQSQDSTCHDCQMDLFSRIQSGQISFPAAEWSFVSPAAKDFVRSLLVKDARLRPSAVDLLNNPWLLRVTKTEEQERPLQRPADAPLLATPSNLRMSSQLSLVIERSNDAYRRQSIADQQAEAASSLSPMRATKFCLGSDDEQEASDEENENMLRTAASSNSACLSEQLLATTPRAGTGNFLALCAGGLMAKPLSGGPQAIDGDHGDYPSPSSE